MITVSKGLPGGGNSELPITGGIKQKLANQVGTVEGIHHQGYILTSRIPSHAKNETCQNQDLILDDLIYSRYKKRGFSKKPLFLYLLHLVYLLFATSRLLILQVPVNIA